MTTAPGLPLTAYDRRTIAYHWLTAVLVAAQWVGAHYIDAFPKGPLRVDARSTHIALGVALAAVVVARLVWRSTRGSRLAALGPAPVRRLSQGTHWLLYGLVIATLVLGVTNAWERGDSLFGLVKIPSFAPADKALRQQIGDLHEWSANLLLILAGLHAAAGLVHGLIWKDQALRRMIPAFRPRG